MRFGASESNPSALKLWITSRTRSSDVKAILAIAGTSIRWADHNMIWARRHRTNDPAMVDAPPPTLPVTALACGSTSQRALGGHMGTTTMAAEPFELAFDPASTALVMIDMQRDFLEPKGFGELLGNDVALVRTAIEPCERVLAAARRHGLLVIHTREGHSPDLADCPQELVDDLDCELQADLQHLPATVRGGLLADTGTLNRLRAATYQARTAAVSP